MTSVRGYSRYTSYLQLLKTNHRLPGGDHVRSWCPILCPHLSINVATEALIAGKRIACPSAHVYGVCNVIALSPIAVEGAIHAPRITLEDPLFITDTAADKELLFAQEALLYAKTHWLNNLLMPDQWQCCMELYYRRLLSLPVIHVGTLVLRNPIPMNEPPSWIDAHAINLVPTEISTYAAEVSAAAAGMPDKQWICSIVCRTCRALHMGVCDSFRCSLGQGSRQIQMFSGTL